MRPQSEPSRSAPPAAARGIAVVPALPRELDRRAPIALRVPAIHPAFDGDLPPESPIAIMGTMKAEDFDRIDEQEVEIREGHPVELVVTVRLDAEESRLLTELAEAEGADPPATLRAALRHYATARAQRTSR